jgi:hypothetical protein
VAVLVVAAVIVGMLFVLFAVVRFAWDFLHDEVPMEGGGSMAGRCSAVGKGLSGRKTG